MIIKGKQMIRETTH